MIEATSELSTGLITNVIIGIVLKTLLSLVGLVTAVFYDHKSQFRPLLKTTLILLGASALWTIVQLFLVSGWLDWYIGIDYIYTNSGS